MKDVYKKDRSLPKTVIVHPVCVLDCILIIHNKLIYYPLSREASTQKGGHEKNDRVGEDTSG